MVKHGQIFSADTQAVFYNWKQKPIQRMLDFDYLCGAQSTCASMKNMNAVISFACLCVHSLPLPGRCCMRKRLFCQPKAAIANQSDRGTV